MVRLYSMKNCPFCDEMKKYLTEGEIEFVEIDIQKNEHKAEFNKIKTISNADSVPIVLVGKQILVPERSFRTIKEGYLLVKNLLNESNTSES